MAQTEDGKIVTVRTAQPGSYMFKIQSFSSLNESEMAVLNIRYFESPVFVSCGHKWKMVVYPYGDKKRGVQDYISLYLVSVDTERAGSEINAAFKMFVHDHIRDNFLTIQDAETRRFHKLKKEWGFARLISLEQFKDPENGYLVNDSCVFGVEISVIPTRVQVGCFSLIKEPKADIFTWKLNKFSTLLGDNYRSEVFKTNGYGWKLLVYPCGDRRAKGTHLSLYLVPHNVDLFGSFRISVVYTKFVLRIRNQLKGNHQEYSYAYRFDSSEGYGRSKFILLKDFKNKAKGFILDDTVIFEAEVNCISKTDS